MQEQEAILQLKAGNICGLEVLYQDHYEAVFRTAYAITRRHADAKNVTHEVFIELFTAIKNYDDKRPFPPWLHTIVVRLSLKETRHRNVRDVAMEEILHRPSLDPSPEDQAQQSELEARIWASVGTLGPKHRAVVVLFYYHDFSVAEIAKALGCSRVTVRVRLHTARARLGGLLREDPREDPPPTDPWLANPKLSRNGNEKSRGLVEDAPVSGLC